MTTDALKLLQDPRRFAIYSRKSKFTEKGDSVKNQIDLCRKYILEKYEGTREEDILVYEDEGFSGGNTNRPHFKEMMRAVKKNELKAIVVYRLDRISRSISDFSEMYTQLTHMDVAFISESEEFDTSTPMGRAMMHIATVFAQLERETTALRIRDNMLELAKTGRWLGGMTPTGYQSVGEERVTIDGKKRRLFKLDIISEEADTVRLIFRLFLEMNSLTRTETYLLQNHIVTKNAREYTRFSIKNILQNPVYMIADEDAWDYFNRLGVELFAEKGDFDGTRGVIAYNKTNQKASKSHEIRDIGEWIIAVGKHSGLVSGADWAKAQRLLEQNSSKSYRKPRSHVALLSGLLFCGNCGSFMRPKMTRRINAAGETVYTYLCETKEKSRRKNCDVKTVNGNTLDSGILEKIQRLPENRFEFIRALERTKQDIQDGRQETEAELDNLRKNLAELQKEIAGLVGVLAKAENTPAYTHILNQINELDGKEKQIRRRMEELEAVTRQNACSDKDFNTFRQRLASFDNAVNIMSVEQKRAALRVLVRRIEWDGEDMHVYLSGAREGEMPLSGLKGGKGGKSSYTGDSGILPTTEKKEPLREDSE